MTELASRELCQRLYDVSGWVPEFWVRNNVGAFQYKYARTEVEDSYPTYSAGYLLRKLQGFDAGIYYSNQWQQWIATAHDNNQGKDADTPEDALCKLSIELIRQGIIKP